MQTRSVRDFLLGLNPPTTCERPNPNFENGPFSIKGLTLVDLSAVALAGGEALTGLGSGNQIGHSEGFGGKADGPAGLGNVVALGRQQYGLNNLEAVWFPNSSVRPRTVMVTKVLTDSIFRAAQMYGCVQQSVADAVMAAHIAGYFGKVGHGATDNIRLTIAPFVHPNAGQKNTANKGEKAVWVNLEGDELKRANYELYWNNYWCTLGVLHEMVTGGASNEEAIEDWKARKDHPFLGFEFAK